MSPSQKELDEWFPTLVRYAGFLLTVILIVASIFGNNDYPSGYVAAAGMILYKTIAGANKSNDS